MDEKVYTLEEIEAFCLGKLAAKEQSVFEQRLTVDEPFQRRVRLIQSLLDGFAAIAAEDLAQRMNHWAEDLREQEDQELIEWYLNGELGPTAKQSVEQRRQTDTAFDSLFGSQQALLEGFEAAQADTFADQLTTWENEAQAETPIKSFNPWIKRLSIAASIALLIGLGGWGYMKNQYSNQKLFAALYQSPNVGGTMGGQGIEGFKEQFTKAHRSLQARAFPTAVQQFKELSTLLPDLELDPLARSYYDNNVEWSLLLAQLGHDQIDEDFRAKLERIATDDSHEYQAQAKTLQNKLGSIWR